ncbi:MAG: PKD domain-containing protein [Myxococcaceae bacterium]
MPRLLRFAPAALLLFAACEGQVSKLGDGAPQPPVTAVNGVPVAVAGAEQTVAPGAQVTLDASASTDPENEPLSFQWTQTGGQPQVALTNGNSDKAGFIAPAVTSPTTLVFRVVVSDGKDQSVASTAVTIQPVNSTNQPPVASIVVAPSVQSASMVTLDGTSSSDPDGDSITYLWSQLSGPTVALSDATAAQPTFTAPTVTANATLSFKLTVDDGHGATNSATASITVMPASSNRPPVANAGAAQTVSVGATVTLAGSATDPDGDAIASYQWTQTSGPNVALNGASTATAKFTAPNVTATTTLAFSLVATDAKGLSSAPAMTQVTINAPNTTTASFVKPVSLHAVTRTGIVVFFITDVAVKASVDYGQSALSQTFTESTAVTRHVIQLSGLTQDTSYQYRVRAGTAVSTGTFLTAFDYATNPKPFSFAVVGDARGHAEWGMVAAAIKAKNPRFAIQTGDNNDAAGSAANWDDYYNVAKDFFANVPVFAAQGNHDTGSNFSVYNIAPQSSSGSDLYYAFVYGNAGFVAINTNSITTTQTNWINSALSTLKGGPLFAFHHHPLYSCGSHGSSTSMQGTFKTTFENNTLTTDFTGHDHDLVFWSTINNVRYVVSGGGGTSLYALSGCQGPFSKSGYGFMIVTINGASVTETFYDMNGSQLYANPAFNAAGTSVPLSSLGNLVVY